MQDLLGAFHDNKQEEDVAGGGGVGQWIRAVESCQQSLLLGDDGEEETNESMLQHLRTLHASLATTSASASSSTNMLDKALNEVKASLAFKQRNLDKLAVSLATDKHSRATLDSALVDHLAHSGLVDSAMALASESSSHADNHHEWDRLRTGYAALHALEKQGEVSAAIAWVEDNKKKARNDGLLLLLHKAKLGSLCRRDAKGKLVHQPDQALQYARQHLSRFATMAKYARDVQALVTSLVLASSPGSSSSSSSVAQPSTSLADLAQLFTRELQSGYHSLSPVLRTGYDSVDDFAAYLEYADKVSWEGTNNNGDDGDDDGELNVPLRDAGSTLAFHTEFLCPVSGELATEDNPPMLLSCGHVFLLRSLQRMGSRRSATFKCPTCPKELTLSDATQIRF